MFRKTRIIQNATVSTSCKREPPAIHGAMCAQNSSGFTMFPEWLCWFLVWECRNNFLPAIPTMRQAAHLLNPPAPVAQVPHAVLDVQLRTMRPELARQPAISYCMVLYVRAKNTPVWQTQKGKYRYIYIYTQPTIDVKLWQNGLV